MKHFVDLNTEQLCKLYSMLVLENKMPDIAEKLGRHIRTFNTNCYEKRNPDGSISTNCFCEIEKGFSEKAACAEAKRCLRCDLEQY